MKVHPDDWIDWGNAFTHQVKDSDKLLAALERLAQSQDRISLNLEALISLMIKEK